MAKKSGKALDTILKKRGPRPRASPSEAFNRSEHLRGILRGKGVWEELYPRLRKAKTKKDVLRVFVRLRQIGVHVADVHEFFPGRAELIAEVIHDPAFPKTRKASQIAFLADSLAAGKQLSPRRSRDICAAERLRREEAHCIVQREFYVECSCGYKGPALNDACRKCQAPIVLDPFGQLVPNFRA
jgi:hypothetical protein